MFDEYIRPLLVWLNANPHWAGIITFTISFAESLAIVGSIIPGSVTMAAIGVLIGTGTIPGTSTFIWAILGAIAGDGASYWLGFYFKDRLTSMWPFSRYPKILSSGETFFLKHGGKSVFVGRFAGPLRSIVPVIAGMLSMPHKQFFIANVLSAIAWSFAYIMPGIIIGAAATELSSEGATNLFFVALVVFIKLWCVAWVIKHISHWTVTRAYVYLSQFWHYLGRHKIYTPITYFLRDPTRSESPTQLALALVFLVVFALFILLAFSVTSEGVLTAWNTPLFYLFQSFRNPVLDYFFVLITFLAEKKVLLAFAGIIFIWLCWQRQWHVAIHWLGNTILVSYAIHFTKLYVYAHRPEFFQAVHNTASFPSGHVGLFVGVGSFLVYLIAHQIKEESRPPLIISFLCAVVLVALSRLYLGAHWLTDVTGAILLASSCVTLSIIFYHRRPIPQLPLKQLCIVSAVSFIVLWSGYSFLNLKKDVHGQQLTAPTSYLSMKGWWEQTDTKLLPLYRLNRLGQPSSLLNIQWANSLASIEKTLTQAKWEKVVKPNLKDATFQLFKSKPGSYPSLLSEQHQFQPPALVMKKAAKTSEDATLVILLWPSHFHFSDQKIPLWIGAIQYKRNSNILVKQKVIPLPPVLDNLKSVLVDSEWKMITHKNNEKLEEILLIKPKEVKPNNEVQNPLHLMQQD